ncbi:MAG: beta strand repeat-containing protein [Pseudolabrys sp.]
MTDFTITVPEQGPRGLQGIPGIGTKGDPGEKGNPGAGYSGTSPSSLTVASAGNIVVTTQPGLAWLPGGRVRLISRSVGAWMEGSVVSYSGITMIVGLDTAGPIAGTYTDWNLQIGGTLTPLTSAARLLLAATDAVGQRAVMGAAPLASPALTGTPTAPTAAAGTNTTQLATTAYVQNAVALLVDSSPAALDTLNELAAALGDDANFSTTVSTQIGTKAPINNPTFTGKATTAASAAGGAGFNLPQGAAPTAPANGDVWLTSAGLFARANTVTLQFAPLASPTFIGTPAAPTAPANTNTTQLATTAFVVGQAASVAPLSDGTAAVGTSLLYARQDHVHPTDTSRAPLASPALTGAPTAPTPAVNTNTTQLATTAFVVGQAGTAAPVADGVAAVGTSLLYARQDHVHPTDTSRAPLASPALTGTPTAPTAAAGTNTTQLATTAYVQNAVALLVNTAPAALDTLSELAAALGGDANFSTTISTQIGLKAPLASPALTGTPTAPTAAVGTNTTQLATTAFVQSAIGGAGSVASVFGRVGAVVKQAGDYAVADITGAAPLASPTFTGTPAAPTATAGTNTTQLATTAFVAAAVAAAGYSPPTTAGAVGTYMFASGTTATFGATVAGSALTPCDQYGTLGPAQTGTWRCMGVAGYGGINGATVWLRIA